MQRGRDRQLQASGSPQSHHRSLSRHLSHRRIPVGAVSGNSHKRHDHFCLGALQEGHPIQVFSVSGGLWLNGVVAKLEEGNRVRVEYEVGKKWRGKSLHVHSDHLFIPSATACLPCADEDDEHNTVAQHVLRKREFAAGKSNSIRYHVAEKLWSRGFTVRQLLKFYSEKHIRKTMTTEDVVSKIIIPETREHQTCYMESAFMESLGGAQRPTKLVSHSLNSLFVNTVLNILFDASGFERKQLIKQYAPKGELLADDALAQLSEEALDRAYWLCVLAVNEHTALCGDCWKCRDEFGEDCNDCVGEDRLLHPQELVKLECQHGAKKNPCSCGTPKFRKCDPFREVDKIVDIIRDFAKEVVVSLDPELKSLERVWILKEISEAVQTKRVAFMCVRGLTGVVMERLKGGLAVVPAVAKCSTTDPKDGPMIMAKINECPGGQEAFDQLMSCMVEISFGVFHRLPKVTFMAASALQRLKQLQVDCTWATHVKSLSELGIGAGWINLKNLEYLRLDVRDCRQLTDVSSIGQGLNELGHLLHLAFNFGACALLKDVSAIGQSLKNMKKLRHLYMDFLGCSQLTDDSIWHIGDGLQGLDLEGMTANFVGCSQVKHVANVDSIVSGLKTMKNLQCMAVDFTCCPQLPVHLQRKYSIRSSQPGVDQSSRFIFFQPNVRFYRGEIDSSVGSIEKLHSMRGDYDFLEHNPAYIQWLFPNYFSSKFNFDSQELTLEEAAIFRSDRTIAERFLTSYELFLDFLGLKLFDVKTGAVGRKEGGEARLVDVLIHHPHNHLRMRRVLASLAVTGFRHYMAPLVHHLEWEMTGQNEQVSLSYEVKVFEEGRKGEPCLRTLQGECFPAWHQYVDGNLEHFQAMTRGLPELSIIFEEA